jgi:hypothetical protein
MEIVSVSPLRVSTVLWQKGPAAWVLTVVCKATYELAPGECVLAQDQEAPNETDEHWNDEVTRSVRAPGDLAPVKVKADVVVVGSAFAPGGVPVRTLTARLVVGKVDKSIECFADRVVAHDGTMAEGAGFTRMPLVYERAAGGGGTTNPVGIRRDARDGYGRITLPNLLPPGLRVTAQTGDLPPIGFGPLAPTWPQRLEKLGRNAASWSAHDWHQRPMPGDVDLAHFNVAPPDQQLAVLRDNERFVLENLHREHPRLMTSLPGLRPCAFVEGRTGAPFRLPMHADTLWIDTDRALCTVTWRRQLPLDRPDEQGRLVVAMEQPGQTLTWAEVEPLAGHDEKVEITTVAPPAPSAPLLSEERTSAAMRVRPPAATLPFAAIGNEPAPPSPRTAAFVTPAPRAEERPSWGDALPFMASGGAAMAPLPAAVPPPLPPPMAPPAPVAAPPPIESPWLAGVSAAGTVAPIVAAPTFVAAGVASSGLLGVSNAAAAKDTWATPRPEPVGMAPAPARVEARGDFTEVLELLWYEADSVPRIRRTKAWKPILDALEQRPVDRDLDDPALANDPMEMEDRREVFEILAHGAAVDGVGVDRALDAGARRDGKFVPQVALLAGQLDFPFDELSTLQVTVTTVTPHVLPTDEALKAAVDSAKAFLEDADELTPPEVAVGMTTRIREAFAAARKSVPESVFREQTDRVLLSQRRYQRRIVFGEPHLRCLVLPGEGDAPVPGYLPESLAKKLPMFQRFRGRLIAEVHQQADQYETHHASLRVVALARATPRRQDR